jgi:GT2 family glycosyltransferase/glycosyltransferase involved in cell wall biosynthesis
MTKTVLVTSEPLGTGPAGGITTFVHHFGRLLLARGDELTWLVADPTQTILGPPPRTALEDEGARVVHVLPAERDVPVEGPDLPFVRVSAALAEALPADADVVYFQDWGAQPLALVRRRRLLGSPDTAFVSVLHSPSDWILNGMQIYPANFGHDTSLRFAERYATEGCDAIAAPSDALRRWLLARGWSLERAEVVGYPVTPPAASVSTDAARPAFSRLVYFGRLQTVKGVEVFVDAVSRLARDGRMHGIEEVVLLGGESRNRIGSGADVVRALEEAGVTARAVTDRESPAAQAFLAEAVADSLVVIPSLVENFPYAVIEATLVPGLNLICSRVGGIPEILAGGERQMFEPHPLPLAAKIAEFLEHGPLPAHELARYDVDAANARWLDLHERVLAARERRFARARDVAVGPEQIDVCVAHHEQAEQLAQLLTSLEAQTVSGFTVSIVDDGSALPAAVRAFSELEARYAPRGWRFLRQGHSDLGAARNAAARGGERPYLLFLGADDIASPRLIELLGQAAGRSNADCLGCYALEFESNGSYPLDAETGALVARATAAVEPPGGALTTALVANPYGLAVSLVRRSAFEAVGGFSVDRWIGYEDYELYVRLVSSGFDVDVVPETLVYHRRSEAGERDPFRAHERVLRVFRERLASHGLAELPDAVCGLQPPFVESAEELDLSSNLSPAGVEPAKPRRSLRATLSSDIGWRFAEEVAGRTSWRVLVGALATKAVRRAAER